MTTPESATVTAVGWIRTRYTDPATTPIQSSLNREETGTVEVLPEYAEGLLDLDGFDYAWLLTWLEQKPAGQAVRLRQVPFLLTGQNREVGVFAMRGPRRPNPIGLHLVRILQVDELGFRFAGVDMVDRTPVLDIKPWVTAIDRPPDDASATVRSGWFDDVDLTRPHTPSSLGPHRHPRP